MYECFVSIYLCTPCAFSAHSGQKRLLGPLGLELLIALCHHVGSGNLTRILGKTVSVLNY